MKMLRRAFITVSGSLPLAFLLGGCQAAPSPQAAPAKAGPGAAKLFLAVDMVQGSKNLSADMRQKVGCTLSSRFPRNSEMVWRTRVHDPATGDLMDDNAMNKIEVKLANGQALEMVYGPHPKDPPGESFWTTSWVVPKEHASGTLSYTVTASDKQGRTGEWKPFSTAPSLPVILDEVLPDVPAK